LSCQDSEGGIHWEPDSKLDPWDHIESAMGLDVMGFEAESKKAYDWLGKYQIEMDLGHPSFILLKKIT
jgi:hypothetical protein